MTADIINAFGNLINRAEATADAPCDRISVRDHIVEVEIGAFQSERGTTQRIRFNIVVEVKSPSEVYDDVDKILSYDRVTEAIEGGLSEERLNLLETLAERVADRILMEPQALRVFVRIEKIDRGPGDLGIEIVRTKTTETDVRALVDTPRPIVLFLANSVIMGRHLFDWLDAAEANSHPVVICVAAPEVLSPQVKLHKMVQRRIDLLAIEQNAWVLASYDDRCVVVGTKTELDWGMRHDQISVWAPSKIVLDAVDGSPMCINEITVLVEWFAKEIQAVQVVFVGETPTGDLDISREVAVDVAKI